MFLFTISIDRISFSFTLTTFLLFISFIFLISTLLIPEPYLCTIFHEFYILILIYKSIFILSQSSIYFYFLSSSYITLILNKLFLEFFLIKEFNWSNHTFINVKTIRLKKLKYLFKWSLNMKNQSLNIQLILTQMKQFRIFVRKNAINTTLLKKYLSILSTSWCYYIKLNY